jgi:hypothetical protein
MPQADVYYSIRFTNETDGGHPHFMYMKLDPSDDPKKHLDMIEGSNHALRHDRENIKRFNSLPEVLAYNERLAKDADAANPERIDANQQFPGEPNRILSAGSPNIPSQS